MRARCPDGEAFVTEGLGAHDPYYRERLLFWAKHCRCRCRGTGPTKIIWAFDAAAVNSL